MLLLFVCLVFCCCFFVFLFFFCFLSFTQASDTHAKQVRSTLPRTSYEVLQARNVLIKLLLSCALRPQKPYGFNRKGGDKDWEPWPISLLTDKLLNSVDKTMLRRWACVPCYSTPEYAIDDWRRTLHSLKSGACLTPGGVASDAGTGTQRAVLHHLSCRCLTGGRLFISLRPHLSRPGWDVCRPHTYVHLTASLLHIKF